MLAHFIQLTHIYRKLRRRGDPRQKAYDGDKLEVRPIRQHDRQEQKWEEELQDLIQGPGRGRQTHRGHRRQELQEVQQADCCEDLDHVLVHMFLITLFYSVGTGFAYLLLPVELVQSYWLFAICGLHPFLQNVRNI